MDSQNDNTMQYAHMSRDQNIDSNGSAPFQQTHHSLGQALGSHLAPPPPTYARSDANPYRQPSTSPPSTLTQPHAGPSGHQPIAYAVNSNGAPHQQQATSPALKRKQMDVQMNVAQAMNKRRKDDDADGFDDGGGQGAKHWTDEEKGKLFKWLMGPNSDDHWNALRQTKNSCLRECADKVFDRKKSYQALKGCYERNFNLFRQIYALEAYHNHPGGMDLHATSEAERLREYERRLQVARKNGCDVGNMTSRTMEHWFSKGWYELFFRRWHGDPATTRPIQTRSSGGGGGGGGGSGAQGGDDPDDDDPPMDYGNSDPHAMIISNGMNGISQHDRPPQSQPPPPPPQISHQVSYINPQSLGRDASQMPPTPQTATGGQGPMVSTPSMQHMRTPPVVHSNAPPPNNAHHPPPQQPPPPSHPPHPQASAQAGMGMSSGDPSTPALLPLPFSPQAMNMLMQYLQSQTNMNKMKMEFMRKREGREEEEHRTRLEAGRLQLEKEKLELEEMRTTISMKQKSEKAVELLARPEIDQSVKSSAAAYLRKIFDE